MSESSRLRGSHVSPLGFVCLLLVLSFLFNPFLVTQTSGGGLSVRHRASYRATVASSELDRYAPLGGFDAHWVAVPSFIGALAILPDAHSYAPVTIAPYPVTPLPLFCQGLWFRPPPAL